MFAGTYEDTPGTSLFFTQSANTDPVDPVFGRNIQTKVEYLASSSTKLKLKRVFLKAKSSDDDPNNQNIDSNSGCEAAGAAAGGSDNNSGNAIPPPTPSDITATAPSERSSNNTTTTSQSVDNASEDSNTVVGITAEQS